MSIRQSANINPNSSDIAEKIKSSAAELCTVARPTLRGLRMPGVVERATQKPTPICLTYICRIQIQES